MSDSELRRTGPALEIGEHNGHLQLPGQLVKVTDERPILRDRLRLPGFAPVRLGGIVEGVSDVPHLGKEGDIGPHLARLAAERLPLGQVRILVVAAGGHLKQGNPDHTQGSPPMNQNSEH